MPVGEHHDDIGGAVSPAGVGAGKAAIQASVGIQARDATRTDAINIVKGPHDQELPVGLHREVIDCAIDDYRHESCIQGTGRINFGDFVDAGVTIHVGKAAGNEGATIRQGSDRSDRPVEREPDKAGVDARRSAIMVRLTDWLRTLPSALVIST